MKDINSLEENSRIALNFIDRVRGAFFFLETLGYSIVESLPTLVRYRNGGLEVDIYHGRHSYEVSAGITGHGVRYSIGEILRASGTEVESGYHAKVARTSADLDLAITELSSLVRTKAESALRDDPKVFALLAKYRDEWAKDLELDVLARQLRPKAEEAFRLGQYSVAASLYDRIRDRLTPAEARKLASAESRQNGKGSEDNNG